MTKSIVLGVLVLASCAAWASAATDYTVGDSTGWALNFDYSTWTSGKTFIVGDRLVFIYPASQHNVEEVSSSAYSSCSSSNPISSDNNGTTTVTLSSAGKHYFICGISTHCSSGRMKLEVDVSATSSPPSPSTPGSATPPTTSTTTAPPPPPGTNGGNSAAGNLSAPLHTIAVLLVMMMLKMGGLF